MVAVKGACSLRFAGSLAVLGWIGAMVLGGMSLSEPAKAQVAAPMPIPAGDPKCAALSHLALADAEIVSAAYQPAATPVEGVVLRTSRTDPGTPLSGLPAFCRVVGRGHPEPGSDIQFEIWLPTDSWNGRYMGVGNGGFAGYVSYREMGQAISVGQATASTDTGHGVEATRGASWARGNPAKLRDYGWRAVHVTTVNAKRMIAAYYGKPADKSYFESCSNGGRQALMEASRFPEDFDGILAGAPAAQFTKVAMGMIWSQQVQQSVGAAFRPEQMQLLQDEVVRQCDRADGLHDGLVDDPRMCRIDLDKLSCAKSSAAQCFSAPQIGALRRLYAGPPKVGGRTVAYPYPAAGAEIGRSAAFAGWDGWIAASAKEAPRNAIYPRGLLQDMISVPFASPESFNWTTDPGKLTAALGGVLDVQPDMSKYFARGGRLILYQGWADPAIPPEQTIALYRAILKKSGRSAGQLVRLFMIPGMQHCFGGTGAEMFGETAPPAQSAKPENNVAMALQQWVERGRTPDAVIGVRRVASPSPDMPAEEQRLHCAFPARAMLTPGADPDKAASYICVVQQADR